MKSNLLYLYYSLLTSSKHIHTPWGEALTVALATAGDKNKNPPFHTQEALLSAVELIRFEVLTDKPYTKTYSRIAGNGINFVVFLYIIGLDGL